MVKKRRKKKYIQNIDKQITYNINSIKSKKIKISELVALIIAFTSLVIALTSLFITNRIYVLTSKDFIPDINFEISDDSVKIINNTSDLFSLTEINYINVALGGYEEIGTGYYVQVPLVTDSVSEYINTGEGNKKEYNVKFNEPAPLAYVRTVNPQFIDMFYKKLGNEYNLENTKAYALPSLQEGYRIIEFIYEDKFHNSKTITYKYYHLHGVGDYRKEVISEEKKEELLKEIELPEFELFNDFWSYCIERYRKKYDF